MYVSYSAFLHYFLLTHHSHCSRGSCIVQLFHLGFEFLQYGTISHCTVERMKKNIVPVDVSKNCQIVVLWQKIKQDSTFFSVKLWFLWDIWLQRIMKIIQDAAIFWKHSWFLHKYAKQETMYVTAVIQRIIVYSHMQILHKCLSCAVEHIFCEYNFPKF